ncbi:MAG: DUF421 domain-containing protein [Alicyclobacillus macrosporangiidus]|uniref:DUF421 domain-containing protein n=1 Tax=Alicyclobacillus macrosporangiidus TaxID=392015 RepID=UPI0026EC18D3|nr:DUF421 domain-containing protein [Alicyclobacillus macrosporangiidus]MCL6600455.1 DUF421 domain-containing protein [Alicyclobacillus macrosporangiidus]
MLVKSGSMTESARGILVDGRPANRADEQRGELRLSVYTELVLRSIFGFLAMILLARLVSQKWTVVAGVAVGALAALVSVNRAFNFYHALVVFVTWGVLVFALQWASLYSETLRSFVNGTPTVLIRHGKVLEKNLRQAKMTVNDMMSLLREKEAFKLADVEFGVLEPDGQVSVMKRSDVQPLTPKDTHLPVENERAPYVVIADGNLIPQNLANAGYERAWLWDEIRRQGAKDWKDVFLAQVDSQGNVYVDLYEDENLNPPTRNPTKPLLLASLKKIQADLEGFAIETRNPDAKAMYQDMARKLQQLIEQVEPELTR